MADHPGNFLVGQPLGGGGGLARVGLIVFADQFEAGLFAVDDDAGGVGVFDRQPRAVLAVLADVGDRSGERARVADLDRVCLGRAEHQSGCGQCEECILHFVCAPACHGMSEWTGDPALTARFTGGRATKPSSGLPF